MPGFDGPRPAPAALVGVLSTVAVTALVVPFREDGSNALPALALVIPVVAAALLGGRWPALVTAVAGASAFNLAFIEPFWTFKIDAVEDLLALVVFAAVATSIGTLVGREGDRRKAAEDRARELESLNIELVALQAERERLAEEATRAAVLERVDEQRAALLRSVSHDLRTPLSTIRAVATDLSEADYDLDTRTELLALVASEAERLDRLVANLLDLSRIEAGALRPDRQSVSIEELFEDTVRRLARVLTGRRVHLQLPRDLPDVAADYSQLGQVASNLLENAARHAPEGSAIRVCGRAAAGRVLVWVDDDGPGVALPERSRIFEPFRRGEASTSSGIGLAICKAIVEAHGGTIEAGNAPGGGARFTVSLPLDGGLHPTESEAARV
ncbi:MAG TPA: ATP-binding protein [Acidimicrobiales bacterium]|nr:ATP-binding protein [Acidimicrobiales bacterium]